MFPENFFDSSGQPRADIKPNPETMQPVRQKTLKRLVEVITDKFSDGFPQEGGRVATLLTADDKTVAATVWLIPKGTDRDYPDLIAQINQLKNVGDKGAQTSISYDIQSGADGLRISKSTINYYSRKDFSDVSLSDIKVRSPADLANFAIEGLGIIAALRQPEISQNDSLPNRVAGPEVEDLLALLEPLLPFEVSQRSYDLSSGAVW